MSYHGARAFQPGHDFPGLVTRGPVLDESPLRRPEPGVQVRYHPGLAEYGDVLSRVDSAGAPDQGRLVARSDGPPDHDAAAELVSLGETVPVQDAALDASPCVVGPQLEPTLVAEDEIRDLLLIRQDPGAELDPLIFLLVGESLDDLGRAPEEAELAPDPSNGRPPDGDMELVADKFHHP